MKFATAAVAVSLLAIGSAAQAEIIEASDAGFVTRDEAVVEASPKDVWLALISPAKWWNDAHTWSGDASNMTLKPQAGGCFCERIPEDPDPAKITLEGSVEHMRVLQAYPERALRMSGGLGPLQSEPVSGVLTIAISEVDEGTRVVWEYVVGGFMRYDVSVIAPAVDGVMSQQLEGLSTLLGKVELSAPEPEPEPDPEANSNEDASAAADVDGAEPERERTLEEEIDAMANN